MTAQTNWKIRRAQGRDLNFLYSSWLKSYRSDSQIGRSTRTSVFFAEYQRVLDHVFSRATTEIRVACLPDDEFVAIGFLVSEPSILHYVFTKESFRRWGIARSLLEAAGFPGAGASYTHKTRSFATWLEGRSELTYNPFLLFSQTHPNSQKNEEKNGEKRS